MSRPLRTAGLFAASPLIGALPTRAADITTSSPAMSESVWLDSLVVFIKVGKPGRAPQEQLSWYE